LMDKGVVAYTLYGNSREYYPTLAKNQYYSGHIKGLIKNSFNNSIEQFASFFTKETDMSEKELKKLREIIDKQIKSKSSD
ncbi:MAG: BlaI/MecI/CopY family transcriptional regulator, partial [Bacteroidota bacterium]